MMLKYLMLLSSLAIIFKGFSQPSLKKENITWIDFQWNNPKEKSAIFLKSRLDTLDYNFNWQLDTGSPYTFLNGATWNIFNKKIPLLSTFIKQVDAVQLGDYYKVTTPPFTFYNKKFLPDTLLKNDKTGGGFPDDYVDKYRGYGFSIGTIGLDMFKNKVLILDFKENKIGYANELSDLFYAQKIRTSSFSFFKNRIIVPVMIGKTSFPFMYDCGASLFTLQTTPKKSKSFAPTIYTDTLFGINNGETGQVHNVLGGKIKQQVKILGKVYKDVIVYVENSESEIFDEANVTGIIGNKLFLDHIVIIDFKKQRFTLLE
jgi:hypothetical protein